VGGGFRHRPRIARQALPNLLHEAGYRTGIIGKLHVAPADQIRFDHRHLDRRATRFVRGVAEEARAFFEERPEQPFFLMVNYSDPHASRSGTDPVRWSFESRVDGVPAEPAAPGPDMVFPFQGIDTPEQRARVAGFYAGVQRLDVGVGLLLDALDAAGRTDDTLVIFVSDHGPPFDRAKTTVYEAGLRVPLLVRWPGVTRPQVSDALVSTLDLAPTVLDATSTPLPSRLHGHTLRPLLEDPDAGWRPHLFAGFNFHGANRFVPRRAIRDHRYKLIHNLLAGRVLPETGIDGDGAWEASQRPELAGTAVARAFATFADPPEWELYDLAADPWEFVDLAGRPELADVEAGLRAALLAERRRTRDPFLDSEQLERMRDRPPWRHAPEDEWD
jgi:N-sulfoglucosamine sulfohydrolase